MAKWYEYTAHFVSLYTFEANPVENWTSREAHMKYKIGSYQNISQPKDNSARASLAMQFLNEFNFQRVPLIMEDYVDNEVEGLSYFLCQRDRLWLGALQRESNALGDQNRRWKIIWKSGEIPYEYDMTRLNDFLYAIQTSNC